ncbi:transcription elongation factor [Starmerella bacillaris]|uniref:Transcription elongation factor SPT5 n=1 Tax=Starmerella bacillaris TaxID=1247836 RepID=A0AAV5RIU1_STABA|nr:transcription elongation factor [Starmerella bacillaris]
MSDSEAVDVGSVSRKRAHSSSEDEIDDVVAEIESQNEADDTKNSDEEEVDSEEEEEIRGSGNKRKRRRMRNQFLDVEAEDDEDEDDFSGEEDGLVGEDGFVQDEDGEDKSGTNRVYRQVERSQDRKFTEEDAEQLAERYRERYGRTSASKYGQRASASVPQQLLLPSVEDPPIFGLNCRIGREKDAVRVLMRKQINLQRQNTASLVYSVFQRDAFPGRIYIEAANQAAVLSAVSGMPNVFANSKVLKVPIKEYPDMFRVAKKQETELLPGKYVRVKRGKYAGDLGIVIDLSDNGLEARLKLLPRLDYGRTTQVTGADGSSKLKERPLPRLFSSQEAAQHDPRGLQQHGSSSYTYLGEEYVKGFLNKDFKIGMLDIDTAAPTLAEISKFQDGGDEGDIDLVSIGEELKKSSAQTTKFTDGERIEIISGQQSGLMGRVTDVSGSDGMITVKGDRDPYNGLEVTVPASHLRKHFNVGDHVRVVRGNFKDDTGLVVDTNGGQVTLLSDASQNEITVFSRDLRAASDTSVKNQLEGFAIQDLVQVNAQNVGCVVDVERDTIKVLCQNGQTVTMRPESIAMKLRPGTQKTATDARGNEVTIGDTVRETVGEQRVGVIIHIYHQYVFMHNRERTENLGVFVNKNSQIATVATKAAREKGLDLAHMNPAAKVSPIAQAPKAAHFNTRKIIGQHVSIGPGSGYKGMKGIIRDASETAARVELEARNKVVTVDVRKLLFTSPSSKQLVTLNEFMNPYGRGPPGSSSGGAPQMFRSGNKTPAWASGGKTPAWAAGGKTPAWASGGKTPAWEGGRTPAWNAGGKTPALNGNKTPAWNGGRTPGGRTPAWNTGGKTPAWNAGGKTPAWNADSGKTPAWSADSGKTPSWSSNEKPEWSEGSSFFSKPDEDRAEDAVVSYDD